MFTGIVIGIIALAILASFSLFRKREKPQEDVYETYRTFLEVATAYREANGHYAKEMAELVALEPSIKAVALKRYGLSLDGKFLIVKHLDEEEATKLINEIGGDSYINGQMAYLTLVRKNDPSTVVPVAHFSIRPEGKLTTTTSIDYDTSGCVAEDGEIVEKKWENKKPVFSEAGTYTLSLKIKDKNGNWSDAFTREVKVVEETGIRGVEIFDGSHFLLYNCGKVLSFGKNEFGQLGIGSLNAVADWEHSALHDGVLEVACGEGFNLFRLYDGTVYGAGNNRHGELASGDKNPQKALSAVWGLENIKQIAAGKSFAAALDRLGNVFVWGDNSDDQLMEHDLTDASAPVKLKGVDGVKEIACGSNFGLALKYDGTVVGWGDNSFGQLGVGYKGTIQEPVVTLFQNVAHVYAGDRFSLVVTENGCVYGAGNNAYAQLGLKAKNEVFFPEEIPKLKEIQALNVKDSLVLAVSKTGKASVWGNFNTPAQKPIYEAQELSGISYIKAFTNNGKKLYLIDGADIMHVVSDLSGKHEQVKVYSNYYDFIENQ